VYDDTYDPDDPYAGHTPWLRRPRVRMAIAFIAVGAFLLTTLISSCGPTRRSPAPATTTTIPTVEVIYVPPVTSAVLDA
jgi:hypothetical protein